MYISIFCESFGIDKDDVSNLTYQSIEAWDSVGHMSLMASLEEKFQIEIDIDDIIDFSITTLIKRYSHRIKNIEMIKGSTKERIDQILKFTGL